MSAGPAAKAGLNGQDVPEFGCTTAFGCRRDFSDNRFVYTVVSSRAGGLSVGVNMNPDKRCNFDCIYCEVNRAAPARESRLDVPVMVVELERTLRSIQSGAIRQRPLYRDARPELLELRHVALSGDGEPTLCPNFIEAVEAIIHLRARGRFPFFKLVLITNASGLDRAEVARGLARFTRRDEVWAKLETGTQDGMNRVNRPMDCTLEKVVENIQFLARQRPVTIQSLFPSVNKDPPLASEIEFYIRRLRELKEAGANIPLVQVYSATPVAPHADCGHLPLRTLSHIARRVREAGGLAAEVF